MPQKKYWMSDIPRECQLSRVPITTTFVDGRVPDVGGWAFMHPTEFHKRGGTFGVGHGQRYVKQNDGKWLKVEG